jgi:phosphate acetyltransferase
MTRHVYVMAVEAGTGKSAVVLGLAEVLSRRADRLALFRPLVAAAEPPDPDIELIRCRYALPQTFRRSFALTPDDLHAVDGRAGYERLLTRVLDGCAAVGAGADVVLLEGSDFAPASPVELDLNIDVARNLAAPVLLVVGGRGRSGDQVLDAARQGVRVLTDRGCTVLGVVCNRVGADEVDAVRDGLPAAVGGLPGGVLPEVPLLAAPTVAEIAAELRAEPLVTPAAPREVARVIVGAMGLPAFLEHIGDGDLVITPGDRADIVAGVLAAHASAGYPAAAGLLLSGGMVAEPIRRLAAGFAGAGIPILAVGSDTYETAAAVREVRGAIGVESERKIATAIALFEDHVDHERLRERLTISRPTRTTPLMFEQLLRERARADRRHIVLPESEDDRVLRAAEQVLLRGVADLTLLGREQEVRARAAALGIDLSAARVLDPLTSAWREPFARSYADLRRHRGVAVPVALDLMADPTYFATMMVQQGHADGLVSGGRTPRPTPSDRRSR